MAEAVANTVIVTDPTSGSGKAAQVDTPCLAYSAMAVNWPKLDALMSGSSAMRLLRESVLPKADEEEEGCYKVRLALAYLYGAYKKTVKKISGKPFSKKVTIAGKNIPEPIDKIRDDVDGRKTAMEAFGRDLLETGVHRGLTHILVEFPRVMNEDGTTPNLQQEREQGLKPYFVHIDPKNLISWTMGSDGHLEEIRIKEQVVVKEGRWGEKLEHRIRVINRTGFEVYTKDKDGKWNQTEAGNHTFGKVPLVTIYLKKTGEMTGESCLAELAEAEEDYFRSYSDQQYGLHYGRFPFLAGTGLTQEEAEQPIVISARTFLRSTNENAEYAWVTHDGEIFRVGAEDLKDKIARMEALGLEPMIQKSGNVTATGQAIDQSNYESDMQSWVRLLENGIKEAYQLAAEIVNVELPEDFAVDIFNEFSITMKSLQYTQYLIQATQGGILSRETCWEALRRFGILSETHTAETEKERLESQGPMLGMLGLNIPDEDDNNNGGQE